MRYALYFTPAENDPLTVAAASWLGRDAFTGTEFPSPADAALDAADIRSLTADARRYGFHATLKAPFALREDRSESELIAALEEFCAANQAFEIPKLVVGQLGRFFALVPYGHYSELQDFTARVVEQFEPFRAPLSEADIARRKPENLSPPQRSYLQQYGYPYVMEEFRFHMTLTAQVGDELTAPMRQELERRFADFTYRPLAIDGIGLFIEPERGAPFSVLKRLPLAAAPTTERPQP